MNYILYLWALAIPQATPEMTPQEKSNYQQAEQAYGTMPYSWQRATSDDRRKLDYLRTRHEVLGEDPN
jgi:hypothetical protein